MILLNQLKEDPNMLLKYDALIMECIKSGILEEVTKPESVEVRRTITYHIMLSSGGIKRQQRWELFVMHPAKSNGSSLNDCLYTDYCSSLSQTIMNIILRLQTNREAFVGDIEKAFLNVSVAKEDRDVLRFLWVANVNKESPELCWGLPDLYLVHHLVPSCSMQRSNTTWRDIIKNTAQNLPTLS